MCVFVCLVWIFIQDVELKRSRTIAIATEPDNAAIQMQTHIHTRIVGDDTLTALLSHTIFVSPVDWSVCVRYYKTQFECLHAITTSPFCNIHMNSLGSFTYRTEYGNM